MKIFMRFFLVCFLFVAPHMAMAGTPIALDLSQSDAFSVLGHSCEGIQEQSFATGFIAGGISGEISLQTKCGGSGNGGGYSSTTYSSWENVTWNLKGAVTSYSTLNTAPSYDPNFSATDSQGDKIYNTLSAINVTPNMCTVSNTSYCTYSAWLMVSSVPEPEEWVLMASGAAFFRWVSRRQAARKAV